MFGVGILKKLRTKSDNKSTMSSFQEEKWYKICGRRFWGPLNFSILIFGKYTLRNGTS